MSPAITEEMTAALPAVAREIEQFAASEGWERPARMFALVETAELLEAEPGLAEQLNTGSPLTPVAQDELPGNDIGEALAGIAWPERVLGCALVQEIVVLPPEAEQELPGEDEAARNTAAQHPDRREARLVAAVLRGGTQTCVLRLRNKDPELDDGFDGDPEQEEGELVEDSALAPNLLNAMHATFEE
ncbi:hypothetical protein CDG81_17240 [Actinopolyspora erythraea]|uniref:Uncharacterized protein n=2 Tax=Actinopolyspora TaxID=1849 RepID=A0A099D0W9_9ACTN|nr:MULTISPECIES: PPA1309 family protein [Actinopolyspora]ASU79719.1 hypothetical protein CDG81_17240 [Actinopolyspora erythraea]KGI79561.1 hypothetical protein IL38_22870 [Actinopolyspora erythraea]SDP83959.1 hypothetical protein SAMN04487905_11064 [Actinopolyspora xinjiangensis]